MLPALDTARLRMVEPAALPIPSPPSLVLDYSNIMGAGMLCRLELTHGFKPAVKVVTRPRVNFVKCRTLLRLQENFSFSFMRLRTWPFLDPKRGQESFFLSQILHLPRPPATMAHEGRNDMERGVGNKCNCILLGLSFTPFSCCGAVQLL